MNTVIVTGAAGFIGSALCWRLLMDGYYVIGVDNFSTGLQSNIDRLVQQKRFSFVAGDVCDPLVWDKLRQFMHPKFIFHFASPASPPHYQRLAIETINVNTVGLMNCLKFTGSLARVIFASTSEVYGDPEIHPQPESYYGNVNSFGPRACYDEAKRCGEAIIWSWNNKYKSRHGLVRIFNSYGPGMNPNDGRVVVNFLQQALLGHSLTVYGTGSQTRSFCYIDDTVEGILRYAKSSVMEPLNIGNDREFTILQLAEIVQSLFQEKKLNIAFSNLPVNDPTQRRPDLNKTRELLHWEPEISLEDGLRKYLEDEDNWGPIIS